DPRLYALTLSAEHLSRSQQPLVPEKMFIAGGSSHNGDGASPQNGLLGTLISLLVAEKSGFSPADGDGMSAMKEFADKMTRDAISKMTQPPPSVEVKKVVAAE